MVRDWNGPDQNTVYCKVRPRMRKEKKEMRTAGTSQGTQKGKSLKGYSTAWVRRAKRVRHLVYTSPSEEEVFGFREEKMSIPEGPPVTGIETGRLIEMVKDYTLEAETERKRCGNIKGDVSGHMRKCHNDVLQIVRVLGDRLGTVGKDSVPDAVAQLRAENKLIMERNKFLIEEVARLKRKMKRKDVPPRNSAPAESVIAVSAASASTSGVIKIGNAVNKPGQRSVGEERLAAAREEESMDLRAIANLIRSLARSQVKMQQDLDSLMVPAGIDVIPVRVNPVGTTNSSGTRKEVARPGNGQGPSSGAKEGSRRNRSGRNRESVVVSLTCDKEESYREALQNIQEKVNFRELEIKDLPCRRGLTRSFIWQVRGKGANAKADKMAQALKGALPEAKINRPQRVSPFRLIGILPNASHTRRRDALFKGAGGPPGATAPTKEGTGAPVGKGKIGRANSTVANSDTVFCEVRELVVSDLDAMEIDLPEPRSSVNANDLLAQRMLETGTGLAIVAEQWWVPPGDGKWFPSLGGTPLAAVLIGRDGGESCSLVRQGDYFVAVKWGDSLIVSIYFPPSETVNNFCRLLDELEELLGTYPTLPELVAGDFNAWSHVWDPEGRSNLRDELLCMWANQLNLNLSNQ
ncbi:hypothetical protein M0804_013123 [Polistes exclamans]|nr:hypothetical protein M0804_013123 [Polistes exclamans]